MATEKISERDERLKKLEEIKQAGINPYASKAHRTHLINDVVNDFKELEKNKKKIILAGRLRTIRTHGNLTFANLQDVSGQIQLAFSKKDLGDADYKLLVKQIDMGDFIEAAGICFTTHKGEDSLLVESWSLLTKSIRPLPDKWHGLVDDDKRQRFRELEMISNRDVFEKFQRRSRATRVIREFMWSNGYTEVETPILQNVYGGTYAKPFTTHYNALDFDLYLRIAPEIFLKRSITGGFEKVFEIGKCFRNEGMDPSHLQEFTMFEFYSPFHNYEDLMDYTEKLILEIVEKAYNGNFELKFGNNLINFKPPFPRKTFRELIKEYLNVELEDLDTEDKIKKYVEDNNVEIDFKGKVGWATQIDELYKKTVRKKIIQPVFVTDYPKEFMALAKTKDDDDKTVATFQLVVNSWELLKAYNELNNPIDQKERFEDQERLIMEGDEEAMPYDHDFVESMEYGMPPMAGWGMGLDRFFALLEGEENLRDMIIFPTMKPKQQNTDNKKTAAKKTQVEAGTQDLGLNYEEALKLLDANIKDEIIKFHCIETEAIMRALAKHFGEDEERWGIIGLLHDIDWELTKTDIENHTIKAVKILKDAGASDFLIESVVSHAYGNEMCGEYPDKQRSGQLQHCLVAAETLTGLIIANALMQPDKKLASVKLSSLKKKFKQKSFAANCNRDLIQECEQADISLDEFLEIGLKALQGVSDKLNL